MRYCNHAKITKGCPVCTNEIFNRALEHNSTTEITDPPMFADAKVGDRVCHVILGWAKIVKVSPAGRHEEFKVKYEDGTSYGTGWSWLDGRIDKRDLNPSFFWNEVKIVPPGRPREILRCKVCQEEIIMGDICVQCNEGKEAQHIPCDACDGLKAIEREVETELRRSNSDAWSALTVVVKAILNQHHTCGK